jgi:hypothetical protein
LSAANRYADGFKVVEAAVLESFWYACSGQEGFGASGALAPAGFYADALYKLPPSASTIRAWGKL